MILLEINYLEFTKLSSQVAFLHSWTRTGGGGDLTRECLYHRGHQTICWVSSIASYLPDVGGFYVIRQSPFCGIYHFRLEWLSGMVRYLDWQHRWTAGDVGGTAG